VRQDAFGTPSGFAARLTSQPPTATWIPAEPYGQRQHAPNDESLRDNRAERKYTARPWLSGRVVMQRPAKPCTSVRFRAQPPISTPWGPYNRPMGYVLQAQHPVAVSVCLPGPILAYPLLSDIAIRPARVAKLVDARDLKSLDFGHAGSNPALGTILRGVLPSDLIATSCKVQLIRESPALPPSHPRPASRY
jgi:hypothetical protein